MQALAQLHVISPRCRTSTGFLFALLHRRDVRRTGDKLRSFPSLCRDVVLLRLWRLTPVSWWQHLLTGHWGEVVSVTVPGSLADHPHGKTHLRVITDNDREVFTLRLWKMTTHVDTFWGQLMPGYPEKIPLRGLFLVYLCVFFSVYAHTCMVLLMLLLLLFVCLLYTLSDCISALVTASASWMNPLAERTSCPPCCRVKSTMPTGSVNSCLDPVPKSVLTW